MSPVLRVSEAARTGDVPELKRVLDGVSVPKRDFLLKTRTDGATPLIIAARNGNTAIVQCLLDEYDVDLEQEGTVKIDGDLIECCTPLWMASLGGHLAIVRLLLERGAEVNHTTLTNSTPLRAASFNGHTEVGTKNNYNIARMHPNLIPIGVIMVHFSTYAWLCVHPITLFSLCYKRIGSCLACIYQVMDALGKFGEYSRS